MMKTDKYVTPAGYRLKDVARILNKSINHLRYLESQFMEIAPIRDPSGELIYRARDITLFRTIYYLTYEQAYKPQQIRDILAKYSFKIIANLPENFEHFKNKEQEKKQQEQPVAPPISFSQKLKNSLGFGKKSQQKAADKLAARRQDLASQPGFSAMIGEIAPHNDKEQQDLLHDVLSDLLECKRLLEKASRI